MLSFFTFYWRNLINLYQALKDQTEWQFPLQLVRVPEYCSLGIIPALWLNIYVQSTTAIDILCFSSKGNKNIYFETKGSRCSIKRKYVFRTFVELEGHKPCYLHFS